MRGRIVRHAETMNQTKKTNTANVALIGAAIGLFGIFLIWRGTNVDNPSTFGFILVIIGVAFLLAALVERYKS